VRRGGVPSVRILISGPVAGQLVVIEFGSEFVVAKLAVRVLVAFPIDLTSAIEGESIIHPGCGIAATHGDQKSN
jgi:hypothetical protein